MSWSKRAWERIVPIYQRILEHPFIKELQSGELPVEKFKFYMAQDAHYLQEFGSVLALLGAKAPTQESALQYIEFGKTAIIAEKSLHESYFVEYQVTALDAMAPDCHHYSHYLKSVALWDDWSIGVAAVLPCFWIYEQVGLHLLKTTHLDNHPYRNWIAMYGGEDFANGVRKAIANADIAAENATEATQAKMLQAFEYASHLEWLFWDGAYRLRTWENFS